MAKSVASSNGSEGRSQTEGTISCASDESTPLLGNQADALIACNQKLQELGIGDTIRLPRIVVVGDQSTGKSSLIEAISTVKVPKAKGCCTQCPLAINLSSGADATSAWTCTISIEEHYDFVASSTLKSVTKSNPFGPWQKKDQMKLIEVKTTNDKNEVPELIRAAQSAVVNPGTRPQEYLGPLSAKSATRKSIQFSPNVIRVDISEGKWANLSFVDLPGVIANTGKEKDKYLVQLIRNLVHQYASTERSVNMLTLPMTHDVENSQACAIIQAIKAEAHTLAVFTKADLADDDQRRQILQQSETGNGLDFEHGYHFVVMPDNMELDEARALEAEVFADKPWSQLDPKIQSRLGIENLTAYLRRLLFQKTRETLPGNLNSIQARLVEVDAELKTLPPAPDPMSLPLQLARSVTNFENAMRGLFVGSSSSQGMSSGLSARTAWAQNAMRFRDTVIKAKPTVFLTTRGEQNKLAKAHAQIQSSQSRKDTNNNVVEVSSNDEAEPLAPIKAEMPDQKKLDPVHRFRLEDIRHLNERYYQACVPGEIELKAVEEMNKLSVKHWNDLLAEFMDANSKLLNKQVNEVIEYAFADHHHLSVFQVVQDHVKKFLDAMMHQEWTLAEETCRLEQEIPLTYDVASLKEKEARCFEDRHHKRGEKRLELLRAEAEAASGGSRQKKKKEENDLGPDPFGTELSMSAKNRAYYEVASTRFVDNIVLGIFGRLLPSCSLNLVDALKDHIGLEDPDKRQQIIAWMTEDPERDRKRRRLVREKQQLTEGYKYIQDVLSMHKSSSMESSKRGCTTDHSKDGAPHTPSKRAKTGRTKADMQTPVSTPGRLAGGVETMELDD